MPSSTGTKDLFRWRSRSSGRSTRWHTITATGLDAPGRNGSAEGVCLKKHKLDLELILPSDAGACDACVKRLLDAVRGRPGIVSAHVETGDVTRPKLCVHYDAAAVRIDDVRGLVEQAGAELRARFEHLSVPAV